LAVQFGSGNASGSKNYCVVQPHQGNTTANYQALFDDLQALGVTYVRLSPDWSTVEPDGPGGTNELSRYDAMVNYATSKGIKFIFVIAFTPGWANGCTGGWANNCPTRPPTDLGVNGSANYNNFARRMVERYGDRIKVWEIWNEPNAGYFWQEPGKTGQQIATSYTNLAKGAYNTIKSVDPSATVLVGSVVGANSTGGTLSPLDFFNAMYANGIGGKFDGIAWHPYPWNYNRPMSQDTGSFWSHMSTAYSTMQSKGEEAKKIWITETGYTTQYTNETTVQNYMSADIADFKTKDFLATYCWFSDEDNGELFGLSNANYPLVHRPRWSTFRDVITSP